MNARRKIALAAFALVSLGSIGASFAQLPPPVPALPDTERRTSYSISASTCACSVGFQLYGDGVDFANWLEVFVNGVLMPQSGNWTITSPSNPSLATAARPITDAVLTFNSAQTGTVQIVGARRPRRAVQFQEGAGVSARNLNQAITDMVAMLREDWDKINDVSGRAVLAAPGETLALLPSAATRKNQGACFDNGGNLINCVSVPSSTFSAGANITFTGANPTVVAAVIPPPGASSLGGVQSKDCSSSNQAVQKINTDGSINCASNLVSETGPGIVGQTLASNGPGNTPSFQSGPWTLLATLTASNSATLSDTTHFTSAYNDYEIVFENLLPNGASVSAELQVHSGGSFQATSYLGIAVQGATTNVPTTYIPLSLSADVQVNAPGLSGSVLLTGFNVASVAKMFSGVVSYPASGPTPRAVTVGGSWTNTAAIDGFQFSFSAGTITNGVIKIYGRL